MKPAAPAPLSLKLKLGALAGLSFLLGYGGLNQLTALRGDCGSWAMEWEQRIPFVSAFIGPYLSIDLLFCLAFLLCRDRAETHLLFRRLVTAVLLACTCFLLLPQQLAWQRPGSAEIAGWPGAVWQSFTRIDAPHNLFPSLHVILGILLLRFYWRRFPSPLARCFWTLWFLAIQASTILTRQHHLVDLAGGLLFGWAILLILPERPPLPARPNFTAATLWAGLSLAGFLLVGLGGAAVLFLWPAIALLAAALAQAGVPGFVSAIKSGGRLSLPSRLLMAPFGLGQELSRRHYARRAPSFSRITDKLWIGRIPDDEEAQVLLQAEPAALIDLTPDFQLPRRLASLPRLELPVMDLSTPRPDQIHSALDFLRAQNGPVLILCKAGFSRSACLAACALVEQGRSPAEAFALIRQQRPQVVLRPEVRRCVEEWNPGQELN
ncbi:MAG: hypothetical protein RL095_55 [Verrucomicrobiota bacterium]|jgi:hypothetical protein